MKKYIEKATVLIEAMPYFQKFRGATVVVKIGGSMMDNEARVSDLLRDIAFMACLGLRPVLVHGGGKSISQSMNKTGQKPVFLKGLRVTDEETVRVVEQVLNHEINPTLVKLLEGYETKARGMHGDDLLLVTKHVETDPETGATLDWGFVGDVVQVDAEPIKAFLDSGITPVVTPLGRDAGRLLYNVNADSAATAIAVELKARKLVFMSDVPGLLANREDPGSLISTVHTGQVQGLIERGVIAGGMLPKILGCVAALEAGVGKIHIIDSSIKHSLLLELFTDQGVGTEIVP